MSVVIPEQSLSSARGTYCREYIEVVKLRELGEIGFQSFFNLFPLSRLKVTITIPNPAIASVEGSGTTVSTSEIPYIWYRSVVGSTPPNPPTSIQS